MTLLDRLMTFCNTDYAPPQHYPVQEARILYEETLATIKAHTDCDEGFLIGTIFTLLQKMNFYGCNVVDLKRRAVAEITAACPQDEDLRRFVTNQLTH